ncbi:Crp/Fnr family transcriptional regulator [Ramlibacter sp.]|uniref:Crp/Fnr family transcriptional regulator n=1 Tax=Ramlibacter sp. TaxID=1917967 RepID=UPI003D15354E
MSAHVLHPQALAHDRWFSSLPAAFADSLLSAGVSRRFEAGERICLRGQRHAGLYCVLGGVVHVLNQLQPDRDTFLGAFEGPVWLGELELFDGGSVTHEAQAHTRCTALLFSRDRVLRLLDANPQGWAHLGRLQAMKLRLAYFLLDEFSGRAIDTRLARRLLGMACGYGMRVGFSQLVPVGQEMLARSIGLARASVSPVLRDWQRRGIVRLHYLSIELVDVRELMRIARHAEWSDHEREVFDLPGGGSLADEAIPSGWN